jgi:hypothetical protein
MILRPAWKNRLAVSVGINASINAKEEYFPDRLCCGEDFKTKFVSLALDEL